MSLQALRTAGPGRTVDWSSFDLPRLVTSDGALGALASDVVELIERMKM